MYKKDLRKYLRDICYCECKAPFIISLVSLIFSIYFFVVAFTSSSNAFDYAIPLIIIFIFMVFVCIRLFFKQKEGLNKIFEETRNETIELQLKSVIKRQNIWNNFLFFTIEIDFSTFSP